MAELAVVIVSHNSARWLGPCLHSVYSHAGGATLDVVVVDSGSTDGSAALVGRDFPQARVLCVENRGFAHANNRGLATVRARYVLFLNPDTEIVSGSFAELVKAMDMRSTVGLIGCRQLTPDGELYPTIRRFPTAGRMLWEALGSERYPIRRPWMGERELDPEAYERETPCDWTSGSFMLARTCAVRAVGGMDERFFLYCEEPDLCLRIKRSGWDVRHLPAMTIVHHVGKEWGDVRLAAQEAYARRQYAAKHMSPGGRAAALGALALFHARHARRPSARAALRAVLGLGPAPFAPAGPS